MTHHSTLSHAFIAKTLLVVGLAIAHVAVGMAREMNLRQGKLPNGLTYYIVNGGGTPGSVHYYMYQNVGAILENDAQNGLAHVLEHLAFNTTEHFPEGVMTFLRGNGLNAFSAYTGLDDTRYAVRDVPAKDEQLNRRMLQLLYDWCHGVRITPKDVDKERAIIMEEWRQRNDVNHRMSDFISSAIYNDAKYAHRNVIGGEEQLRSFKAKDVQRFYDTWYRPSLQYIAIIGDIDPDAVEKDVTKLFAKLPAKKVPQHADARFIADNADIRYSRFIDADNVSPSFGLYERKSAQQLKAQGGAVDEHLFTQIFNRLAPRRFAALRNAGQEQFIAASVSLSSLARGYSQLAWDMVPYEGQQLAALQQLADVREDLRVKGFQDEEFDAACTDMYRGMKQVLADDADLGTPDNLMDLFRRNFLNGDPIIPFREQIATSMEHLVELEAKDMNSWMRSWMNGDNLAFVTYSRSADEMNVSARQVTDALAAASPSRLRTTTDQPAPTHVLAAKPTPGKITHAKKIAELDAEEWTLSNGATVYYKRVPDGSGRLFFAGSAAGGRAAVDAADLPSYTAMKALVMQSGVDRYNRNQLYQWVKDKDFDLSLSLADESDGIGGNTAVTHADDFFGYLYMVLTHQRFDRDVFNKYVARSKYIYDTRATTGMAAVQDSIQALLYPVSADNPTHDLTFYNRMRYTDLQPLFNRSFGNAGLFKFCLVGDVPEAEARRLVEQYIAALPGQPGSQPRQLRGLDFSSPQPLIRRVFDIDMEGDAGEVELTWLNAVSLSKTERAALETLRSLLENRLFSVLRERDHAVYSVGVKADYTERPAAGVTLSVHFSTSRDKALPTKEETLVQLKHIAAGEFSRDEFKAALVPLAVDDMTPSGAGSMPSDPMLWMGALNVYAEQGQVPNLADNSEASVYEHLTPEQVAAVATKVLEGARHRDIVVRSLPPRSQFSHDSNLTK